MKRIFLFIFIIFLVSIVANAGFLTGNDIYNKIIHAERTDITGHEEQLSQLSAGMEVLGYVCGVYDSWEGKAYSAPSSITVGQVKDVAFNYLKRHPEIRHFNASTLLIEAFKEAFPIGKSNKNKVISTLEIYSEKTSEI